MSKLPFKECPLATAYTDVIGKLDSLAAKIDKYKSDAVLNVANGHMDVLCADVLALLDGECAHDDVNKHCQDLCLYAASLPSNNPRRAPMLEAGEMCKHIFLAGRMWVVLVIVIG